MRQEWENPLIPISLHFLMITWAHKWYNYLMIMSKKGCLGIPIGRIFSIWLIRSSFIKCRRAEEEKQSNRWMREHAKSFIQFCLRTNKCELSDVEVKTHLDFCGRPDAVS